MITIASNIYDEVNAKFNLTHKQNCNNTLNW